MSAPITDLRPDRSRTYEPAKPLLDRILVRRIVAKEEGPFYIPTNYRERSRLGEVVAIGECVVLGNERYPLTDFVNIGDRITFGEYTAEAQDHTDPTIATIFLVRIQDVKTVERLVRE